MQESLTWHMLKKGQVYSFINSQLHTLISGTHEQLSTVGKNSM